MSSSSPSIDSDHKLMSSSFLDVVKEQDTSAIIAEWKRLELGNKSANERDEELRDSMRNTPFILAAKRGDQFLQTLYELYGNTKSSLELSNNLGITAIHVACTENNVSSVRWLCDHDIQLNVRDNSGRTPLHATVMHGNTMAVRMLLHKHASPRMIDETHWTPLHYACHKGFHEVAECLLEFRADVNAVSSDTMCTCLHIAAGNGHDKVVNELLKTKNVRVDAFDKAGRTPFHMAAIGGYYSCLKVLAEDSKANVHQTTPAGMTALMLSCFNKSHAMECVSYLIERGLDYSRKDKDGDTPLHVAADHKDPSMINLLVKYGADPDIPDTQNETPRNINSKAFVGVKAKQIVLPEKKKRGFARRPARPDSESVKEPELPKEEPVVSEQKPKKRGRPVDPNSKRSRKLAEQRAKLAAGEIEVIKPKTERKRASLADVVEDDDVVVKRPAVEEVNKPAPVTSSAPPPPSAPASAPASAPIVTPQVVVPVQLPATIAPPVPATKPTPSPVVKPSVPKAPAVKPSTAEISDSLAAPPKKIYTDRLAKAREVKAMRAAERAKAVEVVKAAEKAEKVAQKAAQKAERAAQKAERAAEKATEKATEKAAEKPTEKPKLPSAGRSVADLLRATELAHNADVMGPSSKTKDVEAAIETPKEPLPPRIESQTAKPVEKPTNNKEPVVAEGESDVPSKRHDPSKRNRRRDRTIDQDLSKVIAFDGNRTTRGNAKAKVTPDDVEGNFSVRRPDDSLIVVTMPMAPRRLPPSRAPREDAVPVTMTQTAPAPVAPALVPTTEYVPAPYIALGSPGLVIPSIDPFARLRDVSTSFANGFVDALISISQRQEVMAQALRDQTREIQRLSRLITGLAESAHYRHTDNEGDE